MRSFKSMFRVLILASAAPLLGGVVDTAMAQSQRAKLLPDPLEAGVAFGIGVAIYGDTAVIGAPGQSAADVFRCDPNGVWSHEAKLEPPIGAPGFGESVAVFEDTAVVGVPGDDPNSTGSAYVFRRDDNGTPGNPSDDFWVEQARLLASDGDAYDEFGNSVAVFDDAAVIGAPGDDPNAVGSAYVFRRDDFGTPADPSDDFWYEETKLTGWGGDGWWDNFGLSVAISGDIAVIGAPEPPPYPWYDEFGSAYVFRFDGANWVPQAKLTATDGEEGDMFGSTVGVSGEAAVIGTDWAESAYVFRRDDNGTPQDPSDDSWGQEAILLPSAPDYWLNLAVAIHGGTVVVGAPYGGANGAGSAYLFRFDGSSWIEEAILRAADGQVADYFGLSVAVFGDTAVAGAPGDEDAGEFTGSAYVFGPMWTVLMFLNGDNDVDWASAEIFNRLELSGGNLDVSVVVCWDRFGTGNSAYYKVEHDTDANQLATYTEGVNRFLVVDPNDPNLPDDLNMGDPNTLTDFTAWALRHYPSEHYLLDIWNHGGGWGPRGGRGVSWDETDGSDFFTTNEVRDAVATVAGQIGSNVDVLGFDACLMQMIEVAYPVRNSCDYVVGSEEFEYAPGWPYHEFLPNIEADSTPADFCVEIVDAYEAPGQPTLSAFEVEEFFELACRVEVLADELLSGLCAEPSNIQQARQNAALVTFDYDGDDPAGSHENSNSYVDLGHLCLLLAAECQSQPIIAAANDVHTALVAARIAMVSDPAEPYYAAAEGLSIYFPDHEPDIVVVGGVSYDFYANYQNEPNDPADAANLDFVADHYWWHFVKAYVGNSPCGDLDGDGDVNLADLAQLLAHYNMTEEVRYIDGDINGDEEVDLSDLAALLANYGEGT